MKNWRRTRRGACALALLGAAFLADAASARTLRFWNTTAQPITGLQLAPVGSTQWGPNQTANDPDHAVDADERLKLSGVQPGRYDVRVRQKDGRVCVVRDVEVKGTGPYAFAIGEKDLAGCPK